MHLETLRHANIERQKEWDPENKATLWFWAIELFGEVGEACNFIKKLLRERMGMVGSRATKEDLAKELADIVICADLLAMHEGIDLGSAIRETFNTKSDEHGFKTKIPNGEI